MSSRSHARGRQDLRRRGLALPAGLLASASAAAAPWTIEPSVALSSTYQSNPQFYGDESRAGSGELVTVTLPLIWQDERSMFALRPSSNAGSSQGAAGLGIDNRTADLSWTRAFDRGSWRVSGGWARLDLFGAEAADLGVVRPVGYSTTGYGGLGLTFLPTERGQADIDLSDRRLVYHEPGTTLISYRYSVAALQYAYAVTERTQLVGTTTQGRFQPDSGRGDSRDQSFQLGASRRFTESLVGQVTIGRSTATVAGGGQSDPGGVYAASLKWARPTWSLGLSANRSRQPGAYGDLALVTNYAASWNRQQTERLSFTVDAGRIDSEDRYAGIILDQHGYRFADLAASYMLTSSWRLDVRGTVARAESPTTALRAVAISAGSSGGSIGLARVFGRTPVF